MNDESDVAAPGRLDLVRSFVNTVDYPSGPDELATVEGASAWASAHGLPAVSNQAECDRLRGLREALRDVLFANNGEGDAAGAWEALRPYAGDVRLGLTLDPHTGPQLQAAGIGADRIVATLLGIVYDAVLDQTWPRLRACRKATCRFAYYDRSKNASRAWCSMATCGNQEKAHRRRLRDRTL
ncbi:MAG TPA: CGNR zinc finger domain-containing protein [Candidatus Baltobacteraceae bacterium]|nr:CGNR zinc finger domain-containing protein [Candidatus Baltobacteraceae bacterium]